MIKKEILRIQIITDCREFEKDKEAGLFKGREDKMIEQYGRLMKKIGKYEFMKEQELADLTEDIGLARLDDPQDLEK